MELERQLNEELKNKIISILVQHGIKKIMVFGSYIRDEATAKSDIDIIVEFPEDISLLDHIRIEYELSEKLDMKIDLLSQNGISPYVKEQIRKEAIVIYEYL